MKNKMDYVILALILLTGLGVFIWKNPHFFQIKLKKFIQSDLEFKQTLAMGLYYRFNYPTRKLPDGRVMFEKSSKTFLKERPLDFEHFVADLIKINYGGQVTVSKGSGDFGIDFEHRVKGALYLGQVKAYKNDIPYDPIASIHSNMVKHDAKGGYVINTAGFSEGAKQYAKGLNIKLIDGVELVNLWLTSLKVQQYTQSDELESNIV
ncbi:restriction endonuclease [Chengkuizengella axinellae]|uniref:Restriction endonuclease n=1 Tax=Chengkuizengella axinellae TaxID=3064388 RepID=A0ABT9J3L1_9BACL|nr:restriction endonuclease [Chengkuizengella sp. 2205SS18-9]MDP5276205.1 restriction endonuclease [Chengkuizengella sp. 2205SS18-9]